MDVLLLSRLQFATATYFHFLFVPLSPGLSLMLFRGKESEGRRTRLLGRIGTNGQAATNRSK
ncbi:MAG TPA: cytochrome ubiquinol oxidase subunit I [Syntrophorhabdaceae bacterium]